MLGSPRKEDRPDCFGVLNKVFMKGPGGVRVVTQECWPCTFRVECLKKAVNEGEGKRAIKEELAARGEESEGGIGGFMRRWSRLKTQSEKDKS